MDFNTFIKRASRGGGAANDMIGAMTTGALGNNIGTLAGVLSGKPTDADLDEMDNSPGLSYLPGVGAYRLAQKSLGAVRNDSPRATVLSEQLGPGASTLASALLLGIAGAGIGALVGGADGATAGGILGGFAGLGGATLANAIGSTYGMASKRYTDAEQQAADQDNSLAANWFVPGVAAYNRMKRAQSIIRDEDTRNRNA